MATMYAIPALTTWDGGTGGGWSNTSGGASNGTAPTNTTDVIFDANSGASRSIILSGAPVCKTLTTTGANAMTFTTGSLGVYGDVNLTGTVSINAFVINGTVDVNLTSGSATIGSLSDVGFPVNIVLQDDLHITTALNLSRAFNANNHNVTTPSFVFTAAVTVTMGSGTWEITGNGTPAWSIGSSVTIVPGTSTIKFTDNSSGLKSFNGNGKTYNNFWNATQGSGAVQMSTTCAFNNFKINAGRTQLFAQGVTFTVASFTADGTGNQISIQTNTSGSSATLTKSGGGSIYLDYCSIKDISAGPASTWNARNSTNVSGNTGITFIPGNSKLLQFF